MCGDHCIVCDDHCIVCDDHCIVCDDHCIAIAKYTPVKMREPDHSEASHCTSENSGYHDSALLPER